MTQDRIEKRVMLKASRERVWAAISDAERFGAWFGAAFDGPFVAGQETIGQIVPTTVDREVAQLQEPHRGMPIRVVIDRIEPMTLLSFYWHPYAIGPEQDYASEPMTLVTFALADGDGGTQLTITETGFERIPAARRAQAIEQNEGGWAHQSRLIALYLDQQSDE